MELMNWVIKPFNTVTMWMNEQMSSTMFGLKISTWMWIVSAMLWWNIIDTGIESKIDNAYNMGFNAGIKLTEAIK
ncbi:hypothetical protein HN615_06010 [Candidatus Woesearchaeota archaeon]|nr:hypothetical protein [Candidatus Woesearchaeota archaeon]